MATWAGYDSDILYDGSVVTATADVIGVSNPCDAFWANIELVPQVVSGCAFQASAASNVTLETITFKCVADGSSLIHFMARSENGAFGTGTALFDAYALDSTTTLVDGLLTCGAGDATSSNQHAGAHLYADVDEDAVHTTSNAHANENAGGHASADRPAYADPHTDADGQHVPPDSD